MILSRGATTELLPMYKAGDPQAVFEWVQNKIGKNTVKILDSLDEINEWVEDNCKSQQKDLPNQKDDTHNVIKFEINFHR